MLKALKKAYGARKGKKIFEALEGSGYSEGNVGNAVRSFRSIEGEDIYQIVRAINTYEEEPVEIEETGDAEDAADGDEENDNG